ncbi:hypothetical protein [[Phormidium] sp. ETS-05]|uniref:hypothetical protein n=1 Tax=[Phormidium] sp. ETS-05 TaxID=222819 RepID=UPI0018EEE098|nr:hypothetical protein [[Phormidium] sp. ETS-05]
MLPIASGLYQEQVGGRLRPYFANDTVGACCRGGEELSLSNIGKTACNRYGQ